MEDIKKFRKHYFIHRSMQIKYMAMSILPTVIIGVFCILVSLKGAEFLLYTTRAKAMQEVDSLDRKISWLVKDGASGKTVDVLALTGLQKEILSTRVAISSTYHEFFQSWSAMMFLMAVGLVLFLVCVGILALLYSHRVAGPVYRIKRCMEMLADDQPVADVRLRRNDEFKELAEAFNRLKGKHCSRGN